MFKNFLFFIFLMTSQHSFASQDHGDILEVFENVFMVTGTTLIHYAGNEIQHSRNMVVVRQGKELILINSVMLDDAGLNKLDELGEVTHIVRIGPFHGLDDSKYCARYKKARLWAPIGVEDEHGATITDRLETDKPLPLKNCDLFIFDPSEFPEAALILSHNQGNILITCDSVKNWTEDDVRFFGSKTLAEYKSKGYFGKATISDIWLKACKVKRASFEQLLSYNFKHMLSAHGTPLRDTAHKDLEKTVSKVFPTKSLD